MMAWERHVQESKRKAAARARPAQASGKKADEHKRSEDVAMETVPEDDEDYVLV